MTIDKSIVIKNIFYMLTYAFNELSHSNYEKVAVEEFDMIHDLYAEILNLGISSVLKHGLHREYVSYKESVSTLRGRLNINESIQNKVNCKQQLVCEYDDLSEDNLFNQILKTTATILIKHSSVKADKKARLKNLLLFFNKVGMVDPKNIKWTTLRFDRNCKTYQMLLYICYFILDGLLMTTESGSYQMKTFSDNHMCRLYEKFILEYYKKHHPELNPRAAQIDWNIEKESSTNNILPILKTDIFLEKDDRFMIIDAKYYGKTMQQNFSKQTIHSNNLNQIFTYVMNKDTNHTGKVDGMLLYAKTEDDIVPDGQMTYRDGNVIYFKTLDLNQTFNGIKNQLEKYIISLI